MRRIARPKRIRMSSGIGCNLPGMQPMRTQPISHFSIDCRFFSVQDTHSSPNCSKFPCPDRPCLLGECMKIAIVIAGLLLVPFALAQDQLISHAQSVLHAVTQPAPPANQSTS